MNKIIPDNTLFLSNTAVRAAKFTQDDILRLEINLITTGQLLEEHQLIPDNNGDIWVRHKPKTKPLLPKLVPNLMEEPCSSTTTLATSKNYGIRQPPREPYTNYEGEKANFKPKGKRLPLEIIDKKALIDDGRLLNLTAHDPQLWPSIIDNWSQLVVRKFNEVNEQCSAEDMYNYLKTFLGETARAAWESYKRNYSTEFHQDITFE